MLYHLPPGASGGRFTPVQVLFVEGAIAAGGTQVRPPRRAGGPERAAAPGTGSAGGSLPSPLSANTPRSFRSAGFPSSLLKPLAYDSAWIAVLPCLPLREGARGGGGSARSPSFPVATSDSRSGFSL